MSVVAIDIGGANLKVSNGSKSLSHPFALWREPENLTAEIVDVLSHFHAYGPVVVTMTGELADCFETRAEGVSQIVTAVERAASKRQIFVWQTGGEFFSVEEAREFPELVAAANWHALATWAGRANPDGLSVLIDVGSTTTDIIPVDSGVPVPQGTTDIQRLAAGELLYQGVRRTPLCAISNQDEVDSESYRLAAELFATTLDIALLLDDVAEDPNDFGTANFKAATKSESRIRLARMLCSDCDQLSEFELIKVAKQFRRHQLDRFSEAFRQVLDSTIRPPNMLILSGEGEYLTRQLLEVHFRDRQKLQTISLNQILSTDHSQAACAYALAILGQERL